MRHTYGCAVRRWAVVFAFCVASACGGNTGSSGQVPLQPSLAQSSLARDSNPQVSDTELGAVVAGNTAFALKAFPLLDPTPENNTFFSPYSITEAFALLAPGARGTTLTGIEDALSFPLPQDRLNPALNKLDLLLSAKTTGTILPQGLQSPQLSNANAVWGQQGFPILPGYLDTLAVNYGAGLHLVDFIDATEDARNTINNWVQGQTNNRIQDLIPEGGVSSDTRLVLTNAVWFKASWAFPFAPSATTSGHFNNRDNSLSSASFMRQLITVPYVQIEGCQGVDIPYAGGDLSMLILMPAPGKIDAFVPSLTPAVLADITSRLTTKMVDLSIPKFGFTRAFSLRTTLRSLGMTDVFDPARADLSGIDGGLDLFVGAVFHQAFIAVDESGTEAAAATATTVSTTGIPSPDLTLTIDNPFIFLIRDRQTGLILFMGKVVSL